MSVFAQRLSVVSQQSIYGIRVCNNDAHYYYVLAVNNLKERAFKKLLSHPLHQMDFSQFGRLLLSGKGKSPDEQALQMLKEQYAITVKF